jgi:sporulation protein YlmC with PRC-barrel domain
MQSESLSAMRGIPVITRDTGKNIGSILHVYVDPTSKQLSAIGFRQRPENVEAYVLGSDIEVVGEDVVLVSSATAARPMPPGSDLGRQLRKLRGTRVTTNDGKHLGDLEDFDISGPQRALSELHLSGGQALPVSAHEITIGPDEIIVPASYAAKLIEDPGRKGFFARVRTWVERGVDRAVHHGASSEAQPADEEGTSGADGREGDFGESTPDALSKSSQSKTAVDHRPHAH